MRSMFEGQLTNPYANSPSRQRAATQDLAGPDQCTRPGRGDKVIPGEKLGARYHSAAWRALRLPTPLIEPDV